MKIQTERAQIELDGQEASDLAYHIYYSLKQSILDHYISTGHDSYKRGYEGHAKPLFLEQCGKDLKMMRMLLNLSRGDSDYLVNDLWRFFEDEYKKKNGSLTLE